MKRICICGCEEEITEKPWHKYSNPRFINGHQTRGKNNPSYKEELDKRMNVTKFCACGCGKKIVNMKADRYIDRRFISGHNFKNKKRTEEWKKKLREINIGDKNPMYGKKPWNLGIKHSEQTRKKISKANIQYFTNNDEAKERSKLNLKRSRENGLIILPKKDTKIEVKIQDFLKKLGIEFLTHHYIKIEDGYQCDIFIPSMNLVIECDGDYWHGNLMKYNNWGNLNQNQKIQKIRDYGRNIQMEEKGIQVLRLWENEIKEMDIKNFENKLGEYKQ